MSKSELYKHPVYGYVSADSIPTPKGRLAWPFLVEKKAPMEPKAGAAPMPARYEITIILDRNEETKKFEASLRALTKEMCALYNKGRNTTINEPTTILKDGDDPKLKEYEYYHDKSYFVARNEKEVILVSSDGVSHVPAEFLKGGMFVRAQVRPTFTHYGLSFKLEAVQYAGDDGKRFAGGQRSQKSLLEALTDVAPPVGIEVEDVATDAPEAPSETSKAPAQEPVQQEMELKAAQVKMTKEKVVPQPAQGFQAVRAEQAKKIKGKAAAIDLL